MKKQLTELERQILDVCKPIAVQLKGNQADDMNAKIDLERIETLITLLEVYKEQISNESMVSKVVVGSLFYTCSRFYIQSKYSKNPKELLKVFDKLNSRLIDVYLIGGLIK